MIFKVHCGVNLNDISIYVFREKSGRESVIVKLNEEYKTVAVTNVKVRAYLPCFVLKMCTK